MLRIAAACFGLALSLLPAAADEVKLILPSNDDAHAVNARVFAKYLTRHLPGQPAVVIQVVPGASSLVAANYLYNVAPKDGSTMGVVYKNMPLVGALGGDNVLFDARRFTWLGSTADGRDDAVILWGRQPKGEAIMVGTDNVAAADTLKLIQRAAPLARLKQVAGYPNPGAVRLALERGEVDAMIANLSGVRSSKPEWLSPSSEIAPLLQFGNGAQRHPAYPTVPTLAQQTTDPQARDMLAVFESQFVLLRPYLAPPGVPADKAKILQDGFWAAANDPDYATEAARLNIDVHPLDHREAERIVSVTYAAPPETLAAIRALSAR